MSLPQIMSTVIKNPIVLKPAKHILLLSHMRANTSLFGHIIGNHPQINGYYELHIGYYSWKSLIRQKLLFSAEHEVKPGSNYYFDKVLHTEHEIVPEISNSSAVFPIFSLRNPSDTIPSIINLFEKVDSSHEFTTKAGAMKYYFNRLESLVKLAHETQVFYYLDAECIRNSTAKALEFLSDILNLSSPLNAEFKTQKLTGVGTTGDQSGNLNAGTIKKHTSDYSDFQFSKDELSKLAHAYEEARRILLSKSTKHLQCLPESRINE